MTTLQAQHTDLIEQAKADEVKARTEASEKYRGLLVRRDRTRPGDAEAYRDCLAKLGFTSDQADQHLKVIRDERKCADLEAEIPNRQRTSEKASKTLKAAKADRDRVVADAEAKCKQVQTETIAIHVLLQEAVRAKHERKALREKHWELFGLPKPEDPEEQPPPRLDQHYVQRDDIDEYGKAEQYRQPPMEQAQGHYYVPPEAESRLAELER